VVIHSTALPPHESHYYDESDPNYIPWESQGTGYNNNNPNKIAEQDITMTLPASPTSNGLTINDSLVDGIVGSSVEEYGMGPQGLALDSATIFNPLAAPNDNIENEKYTFDWNSGHPEMSGTYHYHSTTPGPLKVLAAAGLTSVTTPGEAAIELYGIMCDGTVILGCTELNGDTPASDDFDSQNGHSHDLVDEEGVTHFSGRYHTHICPGTFTGHNFTPEIQYYQDCSLTGANNNGPGPGN
jgi:hypothetical protein